ncbi:thioredoxin-like protein AAED1, chloroplastic [Morus notabilis]|uniref:thioredoxin-like protein AAED1, chloroplastic n=1 Tax=Morus notabilis TaxID=981085 RepID=UPI000CED09CF|nr:thioredoxin-like protein AAED1, chloroplastic [Morus notabilis]
MALTSARALHAPPLSFPSFPSLCSRPPSLAIPNSHAPSLSAAAQSPKSTTRVVVGLRRHVVARAAVSDIGPSIGEILGDVSIFTAAGEPVLFKDLWDQNEGIAVVALLRHFGCPCCWELASTLKEAKERFDSAGVKLVAVGVGTPNKARILAERLPFPMDCLYADPDRKAYDVLGLYYGFGRTFFNPASAKVFSRFEALQKAVKNYTIEATPDDQSSVLQQGGMFVFKGKQLLYARKDEGTGDHAPLDDIFDVCCKFPVS